MTIIVLCGGLSSERDVSLSSGVGVTNAMREQGHRAVLVDLYFGYQEGYDDPKEIFEKPLREEKYSVAETEPDLAAVRASRKQDNDSLMGDNVFEVCRAADIVFPALHGDEGENGKLQPRCDMRGMRHTVRGYLCSARATDWPPL